MRTQARILLIDWQESHYSLLKNLLTLIKTVQIDLDWYKPKDISNLLLIDPYNLYVIDTQILIESATNLTERQHQLQEQLTSLINQVYPKPIVILTDEYPLALAAIEVGAADYWEIEELTETMLERSLRLILASAGTVQSTALIMSRNIPELKYEPVEAQIKLQASEALYASIFTHSAEAICLIQVQEDGRFIYETVNPAYEQATGILTEEFIGKTPSQIFSLVIATTIEGWFQTCVNVRRTLFYEETLNFPRGVRIWRTNLVPIVDITGKVTKLQGSSRDITEEKTIIEQQLRYSRHQRLMGAINQKIRQSGQIDDILKTAVFEIREALQIDRVLFLQLSDNLTAKVVNEAVRPPLVSLLDEVIELHAYEEKIQHQYRQGYIEVCPDVSADTPNSSCRQVLKSYQVRAHIVVPIFQQTEQNEIIPTQPHLWGFLWLQQCYQPRQWISEEVELLQQLSNQLTIALAQIYLRQQESNRTRELARSNQELEQFAYIVSHDLQSPLGTIASYAQLLQNRYHGQEDEKADKYIGQIIAGTQRMRQQIEDLLQYSRVSTQKQLFQLVDCNWVLKQAIANLKFIIEKNEAVIDISNDLPILMADTSQFVHLFQNLLGNALKYRSEQPPLIQIKVCRQKDSWLFSINDNGIGIEPKYSERIFQIFQRLHTQAEYPGTGIGLAICQRIVQRHGGSIWVESQLGKGTTFFFTISDNLTSLTNE